MVGLPPCTYFNMLQERNVAVHGHKPEWMAKFDEEKRSTTSMLILVAHSTENNCSKAGTFYMSTHGLPDRGVFHASRKSSVIRLLSWCKVTCADPG